MSIQNNEENITKAEQLLSNIEQYSNNLISAYSDELTDSSSDLVTLKTDNFSKLNIMFMQYVYLVHAYFRYHPSYAK